MQVRRGYCFPCPFHPLPSIPPPSYAQLLFSCAYYATSRANGAASLFFRRRFLWDLCRFRGAAAAPLFNPPPLLDGMERRTVITDICNSPEGGNGSRVILGIFTEKLVLFLFSEILRKEGR